MRSLLFLVVWAAPGVVWAASNPGCSETSSSGYTIQVIVGGCRPSGAFSCSLTWHIPGTGRLVRYGPGRRNSYRLVASAERASSVGLARTLLGAPIVMSTLPDSHDINR